MGLLLIVFVLRLLVAVGLLAERVVLGFDFLVGFA